MILCKKGSDITAQGHTCHGVIHVSEHINRYEKYRKKCNFLLKLHFISQNPPVFLIFLFSVFVQFPNRRVAAPLGVGT